MECLEKVAEIKVRYLPHKVNGPRLRNPTDVLDYLKLFYDTDTMSLQEQVLVVYLNRSANVIGVYKHSVGGLDSTIIDVRIILGTALKIGAQQIILSHNHPSGQLVPSADDLRITSKIKEAGNIMDITVVDHLLVDSFFNFYSFAQNGEL